jgi:hypothetical protein
MATYSALTPPKALAPTPGPWLSLIGLTGAATAAYALDTVCSGGTGAGVLILYPAALLLVLPRRTTPKKVRVGTAVPV